MNTIIREDIDTDGNGTPDAASIGLIFEARGGPHRRDRNGVSEPFGEGADEARLAAGNCPGLATGS
ncbi:MAG: hypothetical protein M5U09_18860 [Gammaproteobacteria bacterium]|nr:hypothetical protein [Gammaproteobacteria bacterium]